MTKNINRFKFSSEFIGEINRFCESNYTLNDDDFKDKFNNWKIINSDLLSNQESYLKYLGYNGSFTQKLNKSVYHYFKKTCISNCESTNINYEAKKSIDNSSKTSNNIDTLCNTTFKNIKIRDYIILDFEFLQLIDSHINRHISEKSKIKPSILFDEFKIIYSNEINEQVKKLEIILIDIDKCNSKIKKTYQNRYYNINKKL